MRHSRRLCLSGTIFLICLLSAGCMSNPADQESQDIAAARQYFYEESRTQLIDSIKEIEKEMPSSEVSDYLPYCSLSDLEKSELGKALPVWELVQADETWGFEFDPEKKVTEQISFENTYLFPILVDGDIVGEYKVTVLEEKVNDAFCSMDRKSNQTAIKLAKENLLDINECCLVQVATGNVFLFAIKDGEEIASDQFRKDKGQDLLMNASKVEEFKARVTSFNKKVQKAVPGRPDEGAENPPAGMPPPWF